MIEDTMLEAANTMKAAADEIVRLRRERGVLAEALRDIDKHQEIVGHEMAGYSVTCQIARRALASLERPS